MWIWLIIQGAIGCAFLIWIAVQDWPTHLVGSLLGLPFPALFIFAGLMMRHHRRELKPKRMAYLAGNEDARRELNQARLIRWGALAAVIVAIVVIGRSMPRDYEGSEMLVWVVAAILFAAIFFPGLYASFVDRKIDDAATRSHSGEPPPTPEQRRTQTLWVIALLAVAVGAVAFDQFVDSPVSAISVLVYGAVIVAAIAFVWWRLNPPRDP